MVYFRRYGLKFYPLDGEKARYSTTRWFAVLVGVLLSFLFDGLDVQLYPFTIIIFISTFVVGALGEFYPRVGMALITAVATAGLLACVHLQFLGYGPDDGIGLLYLYAISIAFIGAYDYRKVSKHQFSTVQWALVISVYGILSVVGFGPSDLWLAAFTQQESCGYEEIRWSRPEFRVRHSSPTGERVIALHIESRRRSRAPKLNLSRHSAHSPYGYGESLGRVVGVLEKEILGVTVLGLELSPRVESSRQYWIGKSSVECKALLEAKLSEV